MQVKKLGNSDESFLNKIEREVEKTKQEFFDAKNNQENTSKPKIDQFLKQKASDFFFIQRFSANQNELESERVKLMLNQMQRDEEFLCQQKMIQ